MLSARTPPVRPEVSGRRAHTAPDAATSARESQASGGTQQRGPALRDPSGLTDEKVLVTSYLLLASTIAFAASETSEAPLARAEELSKLA
jgi:hypothetical protein